MKINQLYLKYHKNTIFENFSTELAEGKVTFLLGPTGVGKTSLLRILMGLQKPNSGEIEGIEHRRLSVVFQEDRLLLGLDIAHNLDFITDHEAEMELVDALGLTEYLKLPMSKLSGGTKRRVAILRALTADYDLLLLDEPFTGLDGETKVEIAKAVAKQAAGRTTVIATHDEDMMKYFGDYRTLRLS